MYIRKVILCVFMLLFFVCSKSDGQVSNVQRTLGASEFAIKLADESVTNDTVLQNDDELFVILKANETYFLQANIFITTPSGAPDIKLTLNGPTATTVRLHYQVYDTNGDTILGPASFTATAYLVNAEPNWGGAATSQILIWGSVVNGTTTDFLRVQWAQRSASGDSTTVKAGSSIKVTNK